VGQDGLRLAHPARSLGRSFGQRADLGADHRHTPGAQPVEVGLGLRVGEHLVVHGRRHQHRRDGREQQGGEQIVGEALRHPRQQMGRGGRHDHEVGPLAQADVRKRPARLPDRAQHGAPGERLEGERPHEFRRALRQHDIHLRARLGEPAGQQAALIARDPARHADDDAPAGPHAHASERRRRTSL
jgi:hypothetical protein